ncbi:MAG TPA: hypothetical protein VMV72_09825 [Verrucomicrobiae bacterium]|nr:hypothetical protein [Verrucomicrobiae bacterium]
MTLDWNRTLSGFVAVVYLVVAYYGGSGKSCFEAGLFLILPLACIWFGDAMGGFIGQTGSGLITSSSPGIMVCVMGWLLLLLPAIIAVIYAFTKSPA